MTDKVYKAISDGTRRAILKLLRERDVTAGDIAGHFQLTKPTLSRHFAVLRECGLIQDVRSGRHITYHLNASVLEEALLSLMEEYDFVWMPPGDVAAAAQELVESLVKEDFDAVAEDFDSTMVSKLPPEKLGATWRSVIERYGPFVKQTGTRTERQWKLTAAIVTCEFARSSLDIKVVFSRTGRISGLWFLEID